MKLTNGHWATIVDWQMFQLLVNDLVYYEKQGVGIMPSSAYIGKDGAWDGKFVGCLNGYNGIHAIQAKLHSGKPSQAKNALLKDLIKELPKALNNGVEHFVLATNAELTVQQATELQEFEHDGLKTVTVWYRDILRQRLEKHPGLLQQYFNIGQVTNLMIPETYFREKEACLLGADSFFRKEDVEERAMEIVNSNDSVCLIHGAGGTGKSHLLRRVSEIVATQPDVIVRVVTGCPSDIAGDINTDLRLVKGERLVLICDDVERFESSLLTQLVGLVQAFKKLKLIISCRDAAFEHVRTQVLLNGRNEPAGEFQVVSLDTKDLVEFVKRNTPSKTIEDHVIREVIRFYDANPFFLRLWCEAAENGGLKPEDIHRVNFVIRERYLASARKACYGLNEAEVARLFDFISAATPFEEDNNELINALERLTGISNTELCQIIGNFVQGGVLRQIGRFYRFSPDIIGDLFFQSALQKPGFKESVLVELLPLNPGGIACSLAAARNDSAKDVAAQILESWKNDHRSKSQYRETSFFKSVSQLASLAPESAFKLCRIHMEKTMVLDGIDTENSDRKLNTSLGNISDTLCTTWQNEECQGFVIELCLEVSEAFVNDEKKAVKSLVKKMFCPLGKRIHILENGCELLHHYIDQGMISLHNVIVVETACYELLAASHDSSYMSGRRVWLSSTPLRNTEVVRLLRAKAMSLIKMLLGQGFRESAIRCAHKIGHLSRSASIPLTKFPLAKCFEREKKLFLEWIVVETLSEWSYRELCSLEELCLSWWSDNPEVIGAARLLKGIPRSPQYRFFARQIAAKSIDDFKVFGSNAPSEGRWHWLCGSPKGVWKAYNQEYDVIVEDSLAEELAGLYQTPETVLEFLAGVTSEIGGMEYGKGAVTLNRWVRKVPDLFIEAIELNAWEDSISPYMKETVLRVLSDLNQGFVESMALEIIEKEEISNFLIERFLIAVQDTPNFSKNQKQALMECCAHKDSRVRSAALKNVAYLQRYGMNFEEVMAFARMALSKGFTGDLLMAFSMVQGFRKDDWGILPTDVWELLMNGISLEKRWDSVWPYQLRNLRRNASIFLDLIGRRLAYLSNTEKSGLIRVGDYDVFPDDRSVWIENNAWTNEFVSELLNKLSVYLEFLESQRLIRDLIQMLKSGKSLREEVAIALVDSLDHPDERIRNLASLIVSELNIDSAMSPMLMDIAFEKLIKISGTDKAKKALYKLTDSVAGFVGDDGIASSTKKAIILIEEMITVTKNLTNRRIYREALDYYKNEPRFDWGSDHEYMPPI